MTAELRSTFDGSTMVLTISNPEHRNALGPEMYAAGVEALSAAESNPEVRCVVLTGEGEVFCAGGNLQRLQANRQKPPQVQAQSIESLHNWVEAIRAFPKPVVAAVEGPAAGAGFSLALACDLIVAARNAVFVMAYSSVALSPDGGGSWSLARALPRQLAAELLLGGERIGAQRLHELGVVGRLCDAGQALGTALAWADQLGARAQRDGQHQGAAQRGRSQRPAHPAGAGARAFRAQPAPPQRRHRHRRLPGQAGAALRMSRGPASRPCAARPSPMPTRQSPARQSAFSQSPKRQSMDEPILTMEEREAINSGRWFSSLSPSLRHDILRCAFVRRYLDGDLIAARGEPPEQWIACAKGAVRVSSTTLTGKQITLTYVEPGVWFGDVAMFDGDRRTHDAYAHGDTTILCVARADFHKILAQHTELYEALLQLQARRIRLLFGQVEDLNTLPLRARLAKQLSHLVRSYGVPSLSSNDEIRIALQLAQEELAQLLGASRQRVNQELKTMEREGVIRVEPTGLVVCDRDALLRISEGEQ